MSVDPLADKNIISSPYAYCSGNPIMMIDPDGRDDYEVDADGNVIVKPNPESDNVYWLNNEGERIEGNMLSFEVGAICSFTCNDDSGNQWFEINKPEDAEALLKFFADNNSSVEWMQTTNKYGDNDNPITLLISSREESSIRSDAEQEARNSVTRSSSCFPIIDNHNHPRNTMSPGRKDKLRAAQKYEINNAVQMAIFTYLWGKSPYDKYGSIDTRLSR